MLETRKACFAAVCRCRLLEWLRLRKTVAIIDQSLAPDSGAVTVTSEKNFNRPESIFVGDSEMTILMRAFDWSQTSLGAVETWSQSLKTAVRIMVTSRQAMFVWWGEELINLYNDAYRSILGGKHPEALGQPAAVVWQEIWDQVGPRAATALSQNQGTYDEALLLLMERNGYPEETYYTFSYSPVPDDDGSIGGIICANTEDTPRIIGERQLTLLKELAAKTADARTFDEACTVSAKCLGTNPYDIPFALIYLIDANQQRAVLAGSSGIQPGHAIAPATVALDDNSLWSFADVVKSHQICVMSGLETRFHDLPTGAWEQPPQTAVAVAISPSGQTGKAGILVVGLNPFRLFDEAYQSFIDLVSAQIAASIANAQAYEEERKRAEALAELDRAKTTFFSNVSHEFRTPLTLMLAPIEDALNDTTDVLSANQQARIETVQRNGLRLLKLVNTLLDFSRIEAGRVQASYEPTDLATFTADLASVFRSAIERVNLKLIVNCPPLPEAVYVDREMWEKIVLNLLSNAFKFTFAGEISVSLQWASNQVKLIVQDTGIGIPAAELPHLFERFHRVEGAQGRSIEGSGIGLSLVQELVKLHQGTINVASTEGMGTCFTITIPTGTAHLPPDHTSAPRTLASTAVGANSYLEEALRCLPPESSELPLREAQSATVLHSEVNAAAPIDTAAFQPQTTQTARIVLADDNADMRDYIRRLLNQQYEVDAVSDGVAALAAIHQQIPDLVLTDVMMPNLDGFGLLQALRSDPQTHDIPIIMLSARAGEEARIEGLAAGADDYLIKPFSARELLARVEATLKLARLRQEAAQNLQRSEERYRAFVQQSSEGIWRFEIAYPLAIAASEDEQIQHFYQHAYLAECNQVVAAMYGVASPEDLIGNKLADFLVPSDPRNLDYLRAFIQADYRLTDAESYETDQQGNPKIFVNNLIGIVEDGKLVRAWGTQRDITDRKRAELNSEFLTQLDQRLRQLSSAPAMVQEALCSLGCYLDVDRCLWDRIDWAAGVAIIEQDWRRQDVPSIVGVHQISNLVLPDLVDLFCAGQPAIVPDVTTHPYTAPFADNFAPLNIRAFVAVPCVYEGRWVTTLAVNSRTVRNWQSDEITLLQEFVARLWALIEHARAVEKLHRSEAELRHLANAMPQIVWISRADGFLEFINKRWTEYTGLNLEQSRDRSLMEQVIPSTDLQQLQDDFSQAQQAKAPYQSEFRLIQPDGSLRYFLTRAVPIQDNLGQVRKWYGTSTDITELKQLEAEHSQLLTKEQAARETAESANRIKDEFLAVLSHELRSPLNPILGWAKLLQGGKLDAAKTAQALATIERNAKLQSELIEDLLDVSRILRGKLSLTISQVNLASIIQAAIETVRLAAEAKSIQLKTMLDPQVGMVCGDSTRLQQVVWNLVSNAVKFTPAGGQVTVQLEQRGDQAQITVSDTGKGIAPSFLPHVFDYFRQADSTTTRQFGGLGLGLAIVHHLAELHGGTVWAESPGEGLGATFTVQFPLLPMTAVEVDAKKVPLTVEDLSGLRILAVDDDADIRTLIEFILQQAGAEVCIADSATEALKQVEIFSPDILISDIGMPDLDGYMLMQQIRNLTKNQRAIPAIALTAYAGEIDQKQAIAAGFQMHLPKPVEPETLISTVLTLANEHPL